MTEQQAAVLRIWQERMVDVTTLDLRAVVNVLVSLGMDRRDATDAVVKVVYSVLEAPVL